MRAFVLATAVALSFACATGAMATAFTNGGFEDPVLPANGRYDGYVPTGWTAYVQSGKTYNPQMLRYEPPDLAQPPEGVQYAQMQATSTSMYAGFLQTFDTDAGATYKISGWFRPLAGDVYARVGVDLSGGTARPTSWGAELYGGTSQVWTPFTFQVTATGTSTTIFLDLESPRTGKASAFDGIGIPEPGSVIALLSGLVGLAGCAMRRRR